MQVYTISKVQEELTKYIKLWQDRMGQLPKHDNEIEFYKQNLIEGNKVLKLYNKLEILIEGKKFGLYFNSENNKFYIMDLSNADCTYFTRLEGKMMLNFDKRLNIEALKNGVKMYFMKDTDNQLKDLYQYLTKRYTRRSNWFSFGRLDLIMHWRYEDENIF